VTRRAIVVLAVLGAVLTLSSGAQAGTVAESNTTDGNRTLLQRFMTIGKAIDYNVVADDPDGLYPFCVTLQFEKQTKQGWRAVDKRSIDSFRHDCIKTPDEGKRGLANTHVGWDTFIYPTRRLSEQFKQGKLRIHGFTDLGGDLTYRR
jgi:hypothetical protein